MGQNDLIPYLVRSIYRKIYALNADHQFEKTILLFLKTTPPVNNKKGLLFKLKQLLSDLEKLKDDPYEKIMFSYFDYSSWIKSKIENVPFSQVLREKNA